jgi:hypothetical protein
MACLILRTLHLLYYFQIINKLYQDEIKVIPHNFCMDVLESGLKLIRLFCKVLLYLILFILYFPI